MLEKIETIIICTVLIGYIIVYASNAYSHYINNQYFEGSTYIFGIVIMLACICWGIYCGLKEG